MNLTVLRSPVGSNGSRRHRKEQTYEPHVETLARKWKEAVAIKVAEIPKFSTLL